MNRPVDVTDKRITVAFTGGGSGGHVYPGLAVAEQLASGNLRMVWIGSGKDVERRAVEEAGLEFFSIPSGKLRRSLSLRNIIDGFKVLAGYFAARRLLRVLKPVLLFSKGGYVSVPPCHAAFSLGIPVFTHESDVTPGLATRLVVSRATRIFTSYRQTQDLLPVWLAEKVVLAGNPVRRAVREGNAERGRVFLGLPSGLPVILVLGGSQGAQQVNDIIAQILPELIGHACIVHQFGDGNSHLRDGMTSGLDPGIGARYRPYPFIHREMPDVYAAADIVVGRSGAGTLWESAALGKPMVLIPLCGSGTRGDQVDNALNAQAAGAAVALIGPEASARNVCDAIMRILDDKARYRAMSLASGNLSRGNAALSIATEIREFILKGGKT